MADSAVPPPASMDIDSAQPVTRAPDIQDEDTALDTPLPVLRTPQPIEETTPVVDELDTPMVPLRQPAEQEDYLVFRSPSPALTELYDEDPEDLEYIPGSGQPDSERVESTAAGPANDAETFPLPPSTSSHSMKNRSTRSFEARTRKADDSASKGTPSAKAPAVRKSVTLPTAAGNHSLSALSPMAPALSDAELSRAAGCTPHQNSDKAPDFRKKSVANEVVIIGGLLSVQKRAEETEKRVAEVNNEHTALLKGITQRLSDSQLHSGSASSALIQNTCTDVVRLKKVAVETRDQLSKLTECVNELVDLPSQLASLQREIRALPARAAAASHAPATTAPQSSHTRPIPSQRPHHDQPPKAIAGMKRKDLPPSSDVEPGAKHFKPTKDYFMVYMWDVDLDKAAPVIWARKALKATGIDLSALNNAIHPKGQVKGLISIRFERKVDGLEFMRRMTEKPPRDMMDLRVATREAYAKRREVDVEVDVGDGLSW
ncbi:hypothetical protein C8R43DRAFT_1020242 [Mycena crocata]|nr:hypothetical protein C8R43DRAFT_1020242 [Mycena crocata]